jgi:hypothetical protein
LGTKTQDKETTLKYACQEARDTQKNVEDREYKPVSQVINEVV